MKFVTTWRTWAMVNLQEELNDIETLKEMVKANKGRAKSAKETYLDKHGVEMPYYLRMVVDGNYRTSEALLDNSSFLLDEIKILKEYIARMENIMENGPIEPKASNEPKPPTDPREYTELELKQLSTDGRLD